MFKILLLGGVGNNLFQIARAVTLAEEKQQVVLLKISNRYLPIYKILTKHKVHGDWLNLSDFTANFNLEVRESSFMDMIKLATLFLCKKLNINSKFDIPITERIISRGLSSSSVMDVGYFQKSVHISKSSIDKVVKNLKSHLKVVNTNQKILVLHLRGGDFALETRLGGRDLQKAEQFCLKNNYELAIVTDDRKFAEMSVQRIKIDTKIISDDPKSDFIKMCSANNLYLSNSTFSFWAGKVAKLNDASEVYFPDTWSYHPIYFE